MLQKLKDTLTFSKEGAIAGTFARAGWIGFWVQIVLGSIPITLMLYVFVFARSAGGSSPRSGLPLVEYMTLASLLLLGFTTIWSYYYTRLAAKIADPLQRPSETSVYRAVWSGVVASTLGILFSMLVMLGEVANILIYFLKAPQAGVPVIQTAGAPGQSTWVSTIDIASLMALNLTLVAELVVLILSLWLLFRTSIAGSDFLAPGTADAAS